MCQGLGRAARSLRWWFRRQSRHLRPRRRRRQTKGKAMSPETQEKYERWDLRQRELGAWRWPECREWRATLALGDPKRPKPEEEKPDAPVEEPPEETEVPFEEPADETEEKSSRPPVHEYWNEMHDAAFRMLQERQARARAPGAGAYGPSEDAPRSQAYWEKLHEVNVEHLAHFHEDVRLRR